LLSADTIKINSQGNGDLTNSGTIAGRSLVDIKADTINNLGGRISGGSVALDAKADLNIIGGSIDARQKMTLDAGRDINIETTTRSNAAGGGSATTVDQVVGLYVSNPGGSLKATAQRDFNLVGAVVSNAGNGGTDLIAKNDLNLKTVTESRTVSGVGAGHAMVATSSNELGTTVTSGGTTTLKADRDIYVRQATVDAGQAILSVNAGRDITIEAGQRKESGAYSASWTDKGLASKTSNIFNGVYDNSTSVGSSFSGGSIAMTGRGTSSASVDFQHQTTNASGLREVCALPLRAE
ncbi:hemagglutinin repeat-containing protein, partial [Variovorax robiniae]